MTEPSSQNHSSVYSQSEIIKTLKRGCDEFIGENEIMEKLNNGKKLRIYWGTSPTSPPSFAYYLPLLKLAQVLNIGCDVSILLADVHSFLDKGISSYDRTQERTEFYLLVLTAMLEFLGVDPTKIKFVKGSDFQIDKKFCIDLLRLSSIVTDSVAIHASSQVVKSNVKKGKGKGNKNGTLVSHLLYPMMQCLDEQYMEADIELGGRDQRKIFMFSRDHVTKVGYDKCAYLITPLIPSLQSKPKPTDEKKSTPDNADEKQQETNDLDDVEKMSSSDSKSKLSFMDSDSDIAKKINSIYCVSGKEFLSQCVESSTSKNAVDTTEKHPLLSIIKHILLPLFKKFDRYDNFSDLLSDYQNDLIDPLFLKTTATKLCIDAISPIRSIIYKNIHLYDSAY